MATVAAPLIEAAGLSISFNGSAALSGVDFDVAAGEVHALVGENGAGKSSLMKILGGLYSPDAGSIRVRGEPTRMTSVNDATRAGVAIIHQELNLVDTLSAVDNIFLGKEIRTRMGFPDRRAMRARPPRKCSRNWAFACRPRRSSARCASARSNWSRSRRHCSPMRACSSWTSRHPRFPIPKRTRCSRSRRTCARKASASCSSAIVWAKCSRSPIASPYCATDDASRPCRCGKWNRRRRSSR